MIQNELLISSVFIAGILSFFAPCTFPLLPAYIGFMTDESGEYKKIKIGKLQINKGAIIKTITFVLGLSTSFVILGFGAGIIGKIVNNRWVLTLGGLLVVLLGLHQMELIHFKGLDKNKGVNIKTNNKKSLGTYIMGLSFSLGWTPCVGPILAAVLLTSASRGEELYGAFLMFIYSLGLMIPFLLLSLASSALMNKLDFFNKHLIMLKKIGGGLIVIMGLILMSNQLANLTAFFNNLAS